MKFAFDPVKDKVNFVKHNVSLSLASNFEWDTAIIWEDIRFVYNESRFIAIGYIGLRLHVMVYADRGDTRRVISLRKANRREIQKYAQT